MYVRVNSIYKYNDNLNPGYMQQKRLFAEKIFKLHGRVHTLLKIF